MTQYYIETSDYVNNETKIEYIPAGNSLEVAYDIIKRMTAERKSSIARYTIFQQHPLYQVVTIGGRQVIVERIETVEAGVPTYKEIKLYRQGPWQSNKNGTAGPTYEEIVYESK